MELVEMTTPDLWCSGVVLPKPGMEAGSKAKKDKRMTESLKLDEEDKRKAKKDKKMTENLMLDYEGKKVTENLKLDEEGKRKSKKDKKPRYYFWNPDALSKLGGSGKRTKKILVSVTKEFVEHLKHNNPLPPAHVPTRTGWWMTDEIQDIVAAQDKADYDKRDKVISDFEAYGHAEMEYEVTDDEAEA